MKRILPSCLVGAILIALGGNYAISQGIGKTKEVVALACDGRSSYQYNSQYSKNSNNERNWHHNYENTASVLITTEYYPWDDKKSHTIDFQNSNIEFHISTKDKSVGNESQKNFTVNQNSINNLNMWFRYATRYVSDNDKWTKDESEKFWWLTSKLVTFDFNVVSLEINAKVVNDSMTMSTSHNSTNEFRGKCSPAKTPFKI